MTLTTEVPVTATAKLVLAPTSGPVFTSRDATEVDLLDMGFVPRGDTNAGADRALTRIMGVTEDDRLDLTRGRWGDTAANIMRHFIETAICYFDLSDDMPFGTDDEKADQILWHLDRDGDEVANMIRATLNGEVRDGLLYVGQPVRWKTGDDFTDDGTIVRLNVAHGQAVVEGPDGFLMIVAMADLAPVEEGDDQ